MRNESTAHIEEGPNSVALIVTETPKVYGEGKTRRVYFQDEAKSTIARSEAVHLSAAAGGTFLPALVLPILYAIGSGRLSIAEIGFSLLVGVGLAYHELNMAGGRDQERQAVKRMGISTSQQPQ